MYIPQAGISAAHLKISCCSSLQHFQALSLPCSPVILIFFVSFYHRDLELEISSTQSHSSFPSLCLVKIYSPYSNLIREDFPFPAFLIPLVMIFLYHILYTYCSAVGVICERIVQCLRVCRSISVFLHGCVSILPQKGIFTFTTWLKNKTIF